MGWLERPTERERIGGRSVHRIRVIPCPLDLIGRTLRRTACERLANVRMGNSKFTVFKKREGLTNQ